ncbi:DUF4153 domain-containing protein [Rufibacter immobilis]|uniref:DUF4153 domain-containing protein n=1 Tax=Rufibacter immobilis TaxID=1348778 RepID=A0A3M9MT59_9BACT|nr:DUF4153 domain-containing protein [Rufibacter immobilis]RNI28385.1 DUF4153 domain-containing protein [Rufibacter immobilis]
MREEILSNLHNPKQLEKLYRGNKTPFKREFNQLYPQMKGNIVADYWNERLHYESEEISWGSRNEFLFVLIAALIAGTMAKLPALFAIPEEYFYPRNIGFLVFPFLSAYFAWKNGLGVSKILYLAGAIVMCLVYVNLLPNNLKSDTLILACLHLPLLLWVILGVTFVGHELNNYKKQLEFLRFNGDLAVMTALLLIAGGIMTAITIGLFSLIGYKIEQFYAEYIVAFALPAVPIMASYLTQTNPQLVNKVSPVIARIFSPLVLVMLVIYLGAIIFSGKDPYNDREFLLLFNVLLVGVMALIFFSVAENSIKSTSTSGVWVLLLLSIVTVIVNGIALSAISFRISEWGITPNRVAILGSNVLMLVHLLLVTMMLLKTVTRKTALTQVGRAITFYLPIYFIWTIVVVFLFPLVFSFK